MDISTIEMTKKGLYKFFWHCGREGDLGGVFITEKQKVDNLIGKRVDFGEAFGKHSQVYGTIEDGEITLLCTDEIVISTLETIFPDGTIAGYNPLSYIEDGEEED